MPSRSTPPLTQAELADYRASCSDFGLEMATLRVIRSLGFEAEHAAAYSDPVTNKLRAYDIRARWNAGPRWMRLAIECKSLSGASPLLVHATPRLASEAYHTVLVRYRIGGLVSYSPLRRQTVYEERAPVGRQIDQPSKNDKGDFRSSDNATYEKWLQAVNGCVNLLREMTATPIPSPQAWVIVPILVVPDATLWQVDYDEDGTVVTDVRQVEKTTLILRHAWTVPTTFGSVPYDISHLELVTLPALRQRVKNLVEPGGLLTDAETLIEEATG